MQLFFFLCRRDFDDGAGYLSTDAFVSQTLTQLNKKNIGGELSLEYQLSQTFKTTFRRPLVNIPTTVIQK
jgi:hypothetical protein